MHAINYANSFQQSVSSIVNPLDSRVAINNIEALFTLQIDLRAHLHALGAAKCRAKNSRE